MSNPTTPGPASNPVSSIALIPAALAALAGPAPGPAMAAERSLDKTVTVPATPDQVWDAWTTRAGITSFMAPDAEIDARVGGAFHIHFDPYATPGMKGADEMRYMALQPKRMLSFDWNAPPSLPEARQQRTFVVVRLDAAEGGGTLVRMHHTGWGDGGEWDKAYAYFDKAWGIVLGSLVKRFETGQPRDWTDWLAGLKKMHEPANAPSAPK
jgi:uncharacterized protein YndB with AHSA1/START domain